MNSVAIIDYRLCNLDSIARAVAECGAEAVVTGDPHTLNNVDRVILPGVGSFGAAMANLSSAGLDTALREAVIGRGLPLLGICLGMQLLGQRGTEHGDHAGLGLLHGTVVRLDPAMAADAASRRVPPIGSNDVSQPARVPHIGWNDVELTKPSPLFEGIADGTDFYFVHSYHLESPAEQTIATVNYCGRTVVAAARDNIMAVQFHPEKSQAAGFRLLRNFLAF